MILRPHLTFLDDCNRAKNIFSRLTVLIGLFLVSTQTSAQSASTLDTAYHLNPIYHHDPNLANIPALYNKFHLRHNGYKSSCYSGSSSSNLTHIYLPMYSSDNDTFYYFYVPEHYDHFFKYTKFDTITMKSDIAYTASGWLDYPLQHRFESSSDTVYRPFEDVEVTLPCHSNQKVYYKFEIRTFDPADSSNTVCVSHTQSLMLQSGKIQKRSNPGEVTYIQRSFDPSKPTSPNNRCKVRLDFLYDIKIHDDERFYFSMKWVDGDTIGGAKKSARKSSTWGTSTVDFNLYTQTSSIFPSLNSDYTSPVVIGKVYMAELKLSPAFTYFELTSFENLDVNSDFHDDYHTYPLYIVPRPPNYRASASSSFNGIRVTWDNLSGASGLNSIRVLSQNVGDPREWNVLTTTTNKSTVSLTDVNAIPGQKYIYRIQLIDQYDRVFEETYCFGKRDENGRVTGKVVTKSNNPIEGVPVVARAVIDDFDYFYSDTTDNTGSFDIRNINYGRGVAQYEIFPHLEKHYYDPSKVTRSLDISVPTATGLLFKDTTSYVLTGKVTRNAQNSCPIAGAVITLDGNPTIYSTDENGEFTLIIEEPGNYTIGVKHEVGNRSFSFAPNSLSVNINGDIDSLDFTSTTVDTLHLSVLSGCGSPVADSVLVMITNTADGKSCFTQYTKVYAADGGSMSLILPATNYDVEVVNMWPPNSNIINKLGSKHVDLSHPDSSHSALFKYQGDYSLDIVNPPDKICINGDSTHYLKQGEQYTLLFQVTEVHDYYNHHACLVDTGLIQIDDEISDLGEVIELEVKDGAAFHPINPGLPNLIRTGNYPNQKRVNATFKSIGSSETNRAQNTLWSFVEGHRPRQQTFVTKTPELPFFILHDPPGSGSYSYMEEETTFQQEFSQSFSMGLTQVASLLMLRLDLEYLFHSQAKKLAHPYM